MTFQDYVAKLPRFSFRGEDALEAGKTRLECPICGKIGQAKVEAMLGKKYAGQLMVRTACSHTFIAVA